MAQRTGTTRDNGTVPVTFNAPTAITNLNRFVQLSGVDNVTVSSAVTQKVIGVNLTTTENANEEITVRTDGYALVESGAAFSAGAYLTTDASARAIATVTAGDLVYGIATQTANTSWELVEVKLFPHPVKYSSIA